MVNQFSYTYYFLYYLDYLLIKAFQNNFTKAFQASFCFYWNLFDFIIIFYIYICYMLVFFKEK